MGGVLTSTELIPSWQGFDWYSAGLRYYRLSHFLSRHFGARVWKVSVDAGFDCPNRDGTTSVGGCIFCSPESFSPSRRQAGGTITEQIDRGIERLRRRDTDRFLAYFQPASNTYAPVERLRTVYEEAIAHPGVVGLAIGTRPDCVPDDVLDLLADLARRTWLTIEFGLQTIHDRSLDWLRRGHRYDAFLDAVERCRLRALRVGAHVILGLPGETAADMIATAREFARLRIDAVKIHNLHAVRATLLAEMVARGETILPCLDEYVGYVVNFLEHLPPGCVIDRLGGDAPPQYLVAPAWCANKSAVRAAVEAELQRRNTWQGCSCSDRNSNP
jgi:uncharacterized protein